MSAENVSVRSKLSVKSEKNIFAPKPIQRSVLETIYKTIAHVDQSDLEFLIAADNDTYVDPDIKLYQR